MRSAPGASGACRLPQCLWSRPCLLRTNTSQIGHSLFIVAPLPLCSLLLRARGLFGGVGEGGFANPEAVVVCLDSSGEAFLVARAVAVHDAPEFFPVDLAVVVRLPFFVPLQVGIGQRDTENLGLLDGG